jgi:hypothetical protein
MPHIIGIYQYLVYYFLMHKSWVAVVLGNIFHTERLVILSHYIMQVQDIFCKENYNIQFLFAL